MEDFPNMSLDERDWLTDTIASVEPETAIYDPKNHTNEQREGIKFDSRPEKVPDVKESDDPPGWVVFLMYCLMVYPLNWVVIKYIFKPTIEIGRFDPFHEFNYGWWLLLSPVSFWIELLIMFGYYVCYAFWHVANFLQHWC